MRVFFSGTWSGATQPLEACSPPRPRVRVLAARPSVCSWCRAARRRGHVGLDNAGSTPPRGHVPSRPRATETAPVVTLTVLQGPFLIRFHTDRAKRPLDCRGRAGTRAERVVNRRAPATGWVRTHAAQRLRLTALGPACGWCAGTLVTTGHSTCHFRGAQCARAHPEPAGCSRAYSNPFVYEGGVGGGVLRPADEMQSQGPGVQG